MKCLSWFFLPVVCLAPDPATVGCNVFSVSTEEPGCQRTPTLREIGGQASVANCGTIERPCFAKKIAKRGEYETDDCHECVKITKTVTGEIVYAQVLSVVAGSADADAYELNQEAFTLLGGVVTTGCATAADVSVTVEDEDCKILATCRKLHEELGAATCAHIVEGGVLNCGSELNPCVIAMQDAMPSKNQCDDCYEIKQDNNEWHVRVIASQSGTGANDQWQMQLPQSLWNTIDGGTECTGSARTLDYERESCKGAPPPTSPTTPPAGKSGLIGCGAFSTSVTEPTCNRVPTPRELGGAVGVDPCGAEDKPCFVRKILRAGAFTDPGDCNECITLNSKGRIIYGQVLSISVGGQAYDYYEVNKEAYTILNNAAPTTCTRSTPRLEGSVADATCKITATCKLMSVGDATCGTIAAAGLANCGGSEKAPCHVQMKDALPGSPPCNKCYDVKLKDDAEDYHVKVIARQDKLGAADPWRVQLPGWLWNKVTGQAADCSDAMPTMITIKDDLCEGESEPTQGATVGCTVLTSTESPGCGRTPTPREIGGSTTIDPCGTAEKPCFVKAKVATADSDKCGECVRISHGGKTVFGQILSIEAGGAANRTLFEVNSDAFTILNKGTAPESCATAPALTGPVVVKTECKVAAGCRNLLPGSATCHDVEGTELIDCGEDDDHPCVVGMQDASKGANQCSECYKLTAGTRSYHVKVAANNNGTDADDKWKMQLPGWLWNKVTGGESAVCVGTTERIIEYEHEKCRSGASALSVLAAFSAVFLGMTA